jgi:N-acetylmuramoyl-L-alanine amidase
MRRAVPWIGLLLLAACFVWLIQEPPPSSYRATAPRRPLVQPEKKLVVVLDPGHGGQDSGALCGDVLEKDLTLDVALRTELLLRATGFTTVLTRDNDRYVSLSERASLGNREGNSVFVSIHFNDSPRQGASGVETYYSLRQASRPGFLWWLPFLPRADSSPIATQSESLAVALQTALVAGTNAFNRGIKTEQFYVLANVQRPAVLIEGGFMTNRDDIARLTTLKYRGQLATAISIGLEQYRAALRRGEPTLALAAARPE